MGFWVRIIFRMANKIQKKQILFGVCCGSVGAGLFVRSVLV